MTHHTVAERAELLQDAQAAGFGRIVDGVAGLPPAWWGQDISALEAFDKLRAARRAPAASVPQEPTSKQLVLGAGALLGQPENTADNRHPDWHSAVAKARSVYLAMLAAAPQPPEAAPVQLPEPAIPGSQGVCCGNFTTGGYYMGQHEQVCCGCPDDAHPPYYTEQQVRELLAADKVERKPLTDSDIGEILDKREDIAERADGGGWHLLPYAFARAIERAHGIGKDKA